MLEFLSSLFSKLFGFLHSVLPSSPFGDWAQVTQDMALGLGWMNWLVDVGGCLAIFVIWLGIALAITVIKVVYTHYKDLTESLKDRAIS